MDTNEDYFLLTTTDETGEIRGINYFSGCLPLNNGISSRRVSHRPYLENKVSRPGWPQMGDRALLSTVIF